VTLPRRVLPLSGTRYALAVLRVVLIDAPESADLLAALQPFVTGGGKPLKVGVLERTADLADAHTYQAALRTLGTRAPLHECLLASSDAERARAAQSVKGLGVLHFDDPAELPLRVAVRIGGDSVANQEGALRAYFHAQARRDLDLTSIESSTPERIAFRATAWRPVEGEVLGDASGVRAPFPVEGVVTLRSDGGIESLKTSQPSADELNDARSFVASLVHHGQLETHEQGQRARGTHQIVIDAHGQRRLVRARTGHR
jgi:hypothetical protein